MVVTLPASLAAPTPSHPLFDELADVQQLLDRALERRARPHTDGGADPVPIHRLARPASAFARLRDACALDSAELGLVVLAVASSVCHRIACGYALLRHDPDAPALSVGIAMELLGIDGCRGSEALFRALRPGSPLLDLELLHVPAGGLASMTDSVLPSSRLLGFLIGDTSLAPDIAAIARLDPARRLPELVLDPTAARRLGEAMALVRTSTRAQDPTAAPVCLLTGPVGSGRGLCALHLAQAMGRPLLRADARHLTGSGDAPQAHDMVAMMRRLVREVRLQGAFLYLEGLEALPRTDDHRLRHLLETYVPAFALGATEPLTGRALLPALRPLAPIALGLPAPTDRLTLWRRHAMGHPPAAERCLEVAAHKYRLTGGQIVRAAENAEEIARVRGSTTLDLEVLDEAIRSTVSHALGEVAREVRLSESWDELVVPEETRLLLRVMMANHRHRQKVFEEWGFGGRFSRGLGLSALFSGPPGTGKTMAAGILARELGLPLYQVELSRVVSKWLGETEKNIDRVFAEAEAVSGVVLFDEADSLFARRTEVSSANDRYANLEVNHLLQRIEAFEGIVVLTTNNAAGIDPAFLRRFAYQIAFPLPDAAQRALLWERLIPAQADVVRPIPFDVLARDFEFSGGHVKNAVLRAAFFAAELRRPIDLRLLQLTASLEQKQLGGAVRHLDVGALWRELGGDEA